MKKRFIIMGIAFAIICSGLFAMSKIGEAYMTEVSAEDIAAVWFEHEHPGETYDKIIVEEDRGIENDELTWVVFYNDGKVVAMADINLDFYGDLYF